jgi:hypothetical protein
MAKPIKDDGGRWLMGFAALNPSYALEPFEPAAAAYIANMMRAILFEA